MNHWQRWSGLLASTAIVSLALAACGDDANKDVTPTAGNTTQATATHSPGSSPSAAATATAPTPVVKRCATADLALSQQSGGAAAGTHFLSLIVTNTSGADCTISGFPGVSLVDGGGQQAGKPADRNTAVTAQTITLKPGDSAHAMAGLPNYQNFPSGECAGPSTSLKLFPPDDLNALTTPIADYACPGFSVQVFQPGKNEPGRS